MTTDTKIRLAAYMIVTVGAFAFGRYTATFRPPPAEDKKEQQTVVTHKETVTTKLPDGSSKTVETVDSSSATLISDRVTRPPDADLNVSFIVGTKFDRVLTPTYGLGITKRLLGPVTIGVVGLTDGFIGASIGWSF